MFYANTLLNPSLGYINVQTKLAVYCYFLVHNYCLSIHFASLCILNKPSCFYNILSYEIETHLNVSSRLLHCHITCTMITHSAGVIPISVLITTFDCHHFAFKHTSRLITTFYSRLGQCYLH